MLTAILLDRGFNFASEPADEPKSFGRWTYSKMDVALNVDVVLLDIGRSVLDTLFLSSHLLGKIPEYLHCGHVHGHRNILPYLTLPTYGALTAVRQRERCVRYPSSKMSW